MKLVHVSVMKKEVLQLLSPEPGASLLIDCTVGEGGHAEAFLQSFPDLSIVGLDADPVMLERARERLKGFGDRFRAIETWFDEFFLHYPMRTRPDRIFFDLGISTFHFQGSGRGFSFSQEEPLDMRLSDKTEQGAMEVVNRAEAEELMRIFRNYGEERYARRIAAGIVKARALSPIRTSRQLGEIIWNSVPPPYRYGRIHPATRCFQALRIEVNKELERLRRGLPAAFRILKAGGRMGVLSFHSLEDRIVKQYFRQSSNTSKKPDDVPISKAMETKIARLITRKPLRPSEEEVKTNPPSRSARFRVLEKLVEVD